MGILAKRLPEVNKEPQPLLKVGVAIEMKPKDEKEQHAADALVKAFAGMLVANVHCLSQAVFEIVAPAGLYCGSTGSHIYVCREADLQTEMDKPEKPYGTPMEEKFRSLFHIPRWAIICEEAAARCWQASADLNQLNNPRA